MLKRCWGYLALVLALGIGVAHGQAERGVFFKSTQMHFKAAVDHPFALRLESLIVGRCEEDLVWKVGQEPLPAWLNFDPQGTMKGVPTKEDVGISMFELFVTCGEQGAKGTVKVNVDGDVVVIDPVELKDGATGAEYQDDLKRFILIPIGGQASFRKVIGPAWLNCAPNGLLSGTPGLQDEGMFRVAFQVTMGDGKTSAFNGIGRVVGLNIEPHWTQSQISLPIKLGEPIAISLSAFVANPGEVWLEFATINGTLPLGLKLTEDGTLVGTPRAAGLTITSVGVRQSGPVAANDKQSEWDVTRLEITVMSSPNRPPIWLKSPVTLPEACTGKKYVVDAERIFGLAQDPDGDPLRTTIDVQPGWLSFSPTGQLAGTPSLQDVGISAFEVSASDSEFTVKNQVLVEVKLCK